ncbi:Cysteine--tRNA ligase [Rubrobacter xylanophilus DSM 9941]|uniref:cysteine--tRNA ligase n=1 Tax=Rubrobacter xylanophilus TaxID=49319 RepID=UPI001C6402DB|nr:cysteine--tRNA ligase [Rubrobacter xylanophilus]QYJ15332.1 Cysteine--tRNA ligase [Rubrobacter xylanophilus DSM 9941]
MSVKVRDSLSGGLVEVGGDGRVGIYVCGPTVYNHIHIGNVRGHLFWDVAVRFLRSRGYRVKFVWNITDIDDKIINRANQEGVSWKEIVRRYTDSFHERLRLLGIGMPDAEPRATEHIPEMISLIEELIRRGHAYPAPNGDVYYAVETFPRYGALSKQRLEEMKVTERGQTGHKRNPLDFTLWKASKPGEPSWGSPWGDGRPGWHIECSAMVEKHLPEGADIHGGGSDIRFPHHENELAQSCGAHPERTFVRAWAHHGMVRMAAEKMAKSVGNVVDAKEATLRHGRDAIRMWLLQSHYSQPIDYSDEILEEKRRSCERLLRLYREISRSETSSVLSDRLAGELRERFDAAMREDFNTPEAIAALFDAAGGAGREVSSRPASAGEFASLKEAMREILGVLGFDAGEERISEVDGVRIRHTGEPPEAVLRRVARREHSRRRREWSEADRLREELLREGWTIEDTSAGPVLSRR